MWDAITYPFLIFNGSAIEVLEWISYLIPHFTGHAITYPYYEYSESMSVKGVPDQTKLH